MIDKNEIARQLSEIESDSEFPVRSAELTANWQSAGVDLQAVDAVLRFMEAHPQIDFGSPGALVHFVERFYGGGYEEMLLDSVRRKPTPMTVWMLNRLINGAKVPELRDRYVRALAEAKLNAGIDEQTLRRIDHFLSRHTSWMLRNGKDCRS